MEREIDQPVPRAAAVPRFLDVAARWAWRILVVAAAVYAVGWLAVRLRLVVLPILIAVVLAALLATPVEVLSRRLHRLLATWLVVLGALVVAVGIGLLMVPPLVDQFEGLGDEVSSAIDDGKEWLRTGPLELTEQQIDDAEQRIRDEIEATVSERPMARLVNAVEVVTGSFLALVLAFFFLKDGPALWSWYLGHLRPERRNAVDAGARAAFASVKGWLRGVAITGLVEAVLIGATLLILGVPAVLPLMIITFFAAFFPIVGATLAGALAAVVALVSNGLGDAVIVSLVVLAIQQIEGDVLMPVVMRRQVKLHPAVVLLALAAGAAIAGIVGALLAVPLTAASTAAVTAARRTELEARVSDAG